MKSKITFRQLMYTLHAMKLQWIKSLNFVVGSQNKLGWYEYSVNSIYHKCRNNEKVEQPSAEDWAMLTNEKKEEIFKTIQQRKINTTLMFSKPQSSLVPQKS